MFKGISESLFGKKTLITEKYFTENHIPILKKSELHLEKTHFAVTPTGKFYRGKYKNNSYSIKILTKISEDTKLSEVMFWNNMFVKEEIFIKFIGVVFLNGNELGIVFEEISIILIDCLSLIDGNINFIKDTIMQLISIMIILNKNRKIYMNINPWNIAIANKKLKFIDYGALLHLPIEEQPNYEYLNKQYIKYYPPEKMNYLSEDLTSDIWSFGCLVIDLFSKLSPLYSLDIPETEIYSLHEMSMFPQIPNDIVGLIKDIVIGCTTVSTGERIKIEDLKANLDIFFINNNDSNSRSITKSVIYEKIEKTKSNRDSIGYDNKEIPHSIQSSEEFIKNDFLFALQIEKSLLMGKEFIQNELIEKSIQMKEDVLENYLNANEMKENYKKLVFDEVINFSNVTNLIIEITKAKVITRLISIQEELSETLKDMSYMENECKELKVDLLTLSSLSNPRSYKSLIESSNGKIKYIEKLMKSNGNLKEKTKLEGYLKEMTEILSEFKNYIYSEEHMMTSLLSEIRNIRKKYIKECNILPISKRLNFEKEVISLFPTSDYDIKYTIKDFIFKIEDGVNHITGFNYITKKVYKIKVDSKEIDYIINSKSSSVYSSQDNSIYITGGIHQGNKSDESKKFLKLEFSLSTGNEITYQIKNLSEMKNKRSFHSSILYNNDSYLIIIGGNSITKCEVYCFKNNKWYEISSLPDDIKTSNCSLCVIDDNLYCFNISNNNLTETIFRLGLKNFNRKYIDKLIGFDEDKWEELEFSYGKEINSYNGVFKKAMMNIPIIPINGSSIENRILLMGGYDTDKYSNTVYEVIINYKKKSNKNENKNEKKSEREEGFVEDDEEKKDEQEEDENEEEENNNNDENDEKGIILVNKLPYRLPFFSFFKSNGIFYKNTHIYINICEQSNVIEFDTRTKEFFYYT